MPGENEITAEARDLIRQLSIALFNTTPVKYTTDRGGVGSGGTRIASPGEIKALEEKLWSIPGLDKPYITDKYLTHHAGTLSKFDSNVLQPLVQTVVIGGISAGVAGIFGIGPAANPGIAGNAGVAAGANAGTGVVVGGGTTTVGAVAGVSGTVAPASTASAGIGAGAPAVAAKGAVAGGGFFGAVGSAVAATGLTAGVNKLINGAKNILNPNAPNQTYLYDGTNSGVPMSARETQSSGFDMTWILVAIALVIAVVIFKRR